MRRFIIITALLVGTITFAQERKNTETETVITKKTITDNKGTRTSTKNESKTRNQKMRFDEKDANKTNQTAIMEPAEVNTSVSYDFEGNRFQFLNQEDREGYRLMTVKDNTQDKEYAIIKPSTQNGYYIISKDGHSSFGYFNEEGNFVVERYDEKADKVVSDVYRLNQKDLKRDRK